MKIRDEARQDQQAQQNTAVHNNNMINQQTQIILNKYRLPEEAYGRVWDIVSQNDKLTKEEFTRKMNKIINDFTDKQR
ncbi:MAG: hypothetical protein EOM67_10550 [Spirochaetia bacterium]|nr:hypothetical protein [Spirochaetia bacterium]